MIVFCSKRIRSALAASSVSPSTKELRSPVLVGRMLANTLDASETPLFQHTRKSSLPSRIGRLVKGLAKGLQAVMNPLDSH